VSIFRIWKKMTRIEKAVKIVSDLYEFYQEVPKVSNQSPVRDEQHDQGLHGAPREQALPSSENAVAGRH
jgi:hypothetical protein